MRKHPSRCVRTSPGGDAHPLHRVGPSTVSVQDALCSVALASSTAALAGAAAFESMLSSAAAPVQVKRRWDDDVVFKNQARTEPKQQKRFINDTVRSDFHRRFLDRYIK